ncbi:MAG: succinyl-diaminopimelate desuccinylase [Pseudomonadota bacterium]
MPPFDPVALSQELIRCPSVTPDDAGTLAFLAEQLEALGFACTRLTFQEAGTPDVDNLYARWGEGTPHLAFAGHVDVVPPGPLGAWTQDPFTGEIVDDLLIGRGAVDMKSGVAAMLAAVSRYVGENRPARGSISFLITADEEGPAKNGTAKLVSWASDEGIRFDGCIVGEPTSRDRLGDMIKIGRRGSLNGTLRAIGRQGHVAYPDRGDNAAHRLVVMLQHLIEEPLDAGTEWFDPSSLQVTSIAVDNQATNVIPQDASARFNIRFNDSQTPESLERWLRSRIEVAGGSYDLALDPSGSAFRTEPGPLVESLSTSIEAIVGLKPTLSTSGGTSDARFIYKITPVVQVRFERRTR